MPKKTGNNRRPMGEPKPQAPALHREVKCIGVAAAGILLLLSVFWPGALGRVGGLIHSFLLGLFGFGAFVLPVALIVGAVSIMLARDFRFPWVMAGGLFWAVLSMLHIFNRPSADEVYDLSAFARLGQIYSGELGGYRAGGGIIGSLLGDVLHFFIGRIGSVILLGAAILILLVLLTGRSFIYLVQRGFYESRDAIARKREQIVTQRVKEAARYEAEAAKMPQKTEKRLPFIEYEDVEYEDEDDGEDAVLLVQEDLEEQNKPIVKPPLFARKPAPEKPKLPRGTEIVLFPEKKAEEDNEIDETGIDLRGIGSNEGWKEDGFVREAKAVRNPFSRTQEIEPEAVVVEEEADFYEEPEYKEPEYDEPDDEPTDFPMPEINASPMYTTPAEEEDDDEDFEEERDEPANIVAFKKPVTAAPASPAAVMPSYEDYQLPSTDFLAKHEAPDNAMETRTQILKNSRTLEETLRSFKVEAKVIAVSVGPTVTRYDLSPGPGVKVSAIANLSNDLALSLAAQGIRIEAPIPGKSAVGIEIPNRDPQPVFLRDILEDERFINFPSNLAFAVGKDIAGEPVVADIARMPHLLIAGATGSGKSVCINTLITSILYMARPDEVKLLMIDPKVVELSVYNGIPHLLIPVVTDPKKASGALSWAVAEMDDRYNKFAETGCRDLKGYNRNLQENGEQPLPQIVIIIDELADLMMVAKGEVEESICRLAQKARAAGLHLIVATQRPSVDVITGLIKANIPSRLAFAVSSGTDSRTVLDMYGAEKLLGKGDMLFLPMGQNKPIRVQGGFVSDKEVETIVNFLREQTPVEHSAEMVEQVTSPAARLAVGGELDEFFHEAVEFILTKGKASTSVLQRQFRIGYNRASRLMEDLEKRGIVGPEDGVKPRKVLISRTEYEEVYGNAR